MKKKMFLVIAFVFYGIIQLFAQYPIPSYNTMVHEKATFQENYNCTSQQFHPDAKRYIHVRTTCHLFTDGSCQATVWIYSLDGQTVYGPYTVNGGETLTVEIDEREWGVLVQTEDDIEVSVWISEEKKEMRRKNSFSLSLGNHNE